MDSQKFFNSIADKLSDFFGNDIRLNLLKPFLPQLELLKQKRGIARLDLLDIGAGTGMHANYLTTKGFHVTAVDAAEEMLTQGKSLYPNSKINFVHDSLPALNNLSDNHLYDAVISIAAFQYLKPEDRLASLRRIIALLKPDGFFAILWPVPMSREYQFPLNYYDFEILINKINKNYPEQIDLNQGMIIPDPNNRKGVGVDNDKEVNFHSVIGYMPEYNLIMKFNPK